MNSLLAPFLVCLTLALVPLSAVSSGTEEDNSQPRSQAAHFNKLPPEIAQHVFSFLSHTELGRSCQVSSFWKKETEGNVNSLYSKYGLKRLENASLSAALRDAQYISNIKRLLDNNQPALIQPELEKAISQGSLAVLKAFWRVDQWLTSQSQMFRKTDIEEAFIDKLKQQSPRSACDQERQEASSIFKYYKEKGDKEAIECKFKGLNCGQIFSNSPEDCELIEEGIKKGYEMAFEFKILGLSVGVFGYNENPTEARRIIDEYAEKGKGWAIDGKLKGLTSGVYAYAINLPEVPRIIDEYIEKGYEKAFEWKLKRLNLGGYGYKRNPAEARRIIEEGIKKGIKKAITFQRIGLATGEYGFEKNLSEADRFIDEYIKKGNEEAIECKLEGLTLGRYSYERNPAKAVGLAFLLQFPVESKSLF